MPTSVCDEDYADAGSRLDPPVPSQFDDLFVLGSRGNVAGRWPPSRHLSRSG